MKTPISYYGGKQNMVNEVISLFPPHIQYVEPFVGGAAVFFKKEPSKNEVINDLDGMVVNFYRTCVTNFSELQKMIQGTLHNEYDYDRCKVILKDGLKNNNVEFAWAFWVRCNMSFTHNMWSGFAFGENGSGGNTANKRDNFTEAYMERLRKVEIFQRDAIDVIKLKDNSEDTFFYCDPPYVSSDCGHYKGYTKDDFINLLNTLKNIKGKFLLSSYPEDCLMEFIKECRWFSKEIKQVVAVTGKREDQKIKTECLTWNYDLNDKQCLLSL